MKNMDYIDKEQLNEYLIKHLNESRYNHSLGVVSMAVRLADLYGANREKAEIAALAHDIAKCLTQEESNRLIRYYGLPAKYFNNQPIAHSKIGVCLLRDEFGLQEPDILSAVSYHTTGKANMTLLEEIIYVSDAIEVNRSYADAPRLRKLAETNLHETCREVIEFSLESLREKGREIDSDTLDAYTYIRNILQQGEQNG